LEKGLDLLQQRPLFGFGPQGTGMVSGSRARPHNLYGELLGEYGLAGTIAFALIIWGVAQNAFEARRIARGLGEADDRLAWRTVLAASASFILLLIMGWGFNFLMWHVWLWFGGFQLVALHCLKQRAAFIRSEEGAESELPPLIATARAGTVFSPNDVDGISQLFG
jgi:O-antigen ligase